jgi:cleavage and polyadenylation specificity factor subunit 1
MGTSDGGIGIYIPVEERAYRRLALLQQILSTALETSLALNPRDFRVFRTSKVQPPSKKGVLDGTVLWRFVSLEASLQDELTASIGTTTDLVLENLHELDMLTAFF